ncbi:Opacity protein and related surface antigens [Legionella wadsworthii]|uniref:Opacity protein and related surface antigens n=1 Tax=Legionella wadsworthii TaxID=28088 RepID=A0A378M2H8_9GAMM|nr:outer membrane beta-barrel protein [Legionella wadsworthii]STY31297.1 Opacity protein and related surface antigens [Legionella wadsworthii]
MLKHKILSYAALTILFNSTYAGAMGELKSCPDLSCMPWFLEFGSGISWSNTSHIEFNPIHWNPSPDGYDNRLGTVPLYTAGIGYRFSPLASVDLSYSYRGIYVYKKHQSFQPSNNVNPFGDRTRFFDLNSNSIMFQGTLYGQGWSDKLAYEIGNFGLIQPIIGGGVGVSYNSISNFHTVLDATQGITSVMQDLTRASFAWQLNAGIELKKNRFSLDAGYRYFNAGTFVTNDALITRLDALTGAPITTETIPGWSSSLSANELYITAKISV